MQNLVGLIQEFVFQERLLGLQLRKWMGGEALEEAER